jgi:hypothetical protein
VLGYARCQIRELFRALDEPLRGLLPDHVWGRICLHAVVGLRDYDCWAYWCVFPRDLGSNDAVLRAWLLHSYHRQAVAEWQQCQRERWALSVEHAMPPFLLYAVIRARCDWAKRKLCDRIYVGALRRPMRVGARLRMQ